MKPTLKPPGSERLKRKCDDLLSSFTLKFNVRRYVVERPLLLTHVDPADGRGLHSFTLELILSNSRTDS